MVISFLRSPKTLIALLQVVSRHPFTQQGVLTFTSAFDRYATYATYTTVNGCCDHFSCPIDEDVAYKRVSIPTPPMAIRM